MSFLDSNPVIYLDQEQEFWALWDVPGHPKHHLSGYVTYHQTNHLVAVIDEHDDVPSNTSPRTPMSLKSLAGKGKRGEEIVAFDLETFSSSSLSSKASTSEYRVKSAVVIFNKPEHVTAKYKYLEFTFDGLNLWANWDIQEFVRGAKCLDWENEIDRNDLKLGDNNLSIHRIVRVEHGDMYATEAHLLINETVLRIEYDASKGIEDLLSSIPMIRLVFQFVLQEKVRFKWLRARTELKRGGSDDNVAHILVEESYATKQRWEIPRLSTFTPYSHIERYGNLLNGVWHADADLSWFITWLASLDEFILERDAIRQSMTIHYLERLHRKYYGGKLLDMPLKSVLADALEKLETQIDGAAASTIGRIFTNAIQPSLKLRLADLIEQAECRSGFNLVLDKEVLLSRLVKARNSFSHGNLLPSETVRLGIHDALSLYLLCVIHIGICAGGSEKELHELVESMMEKHYFWFTQVPRG